ncbi:LRR receptor kinase SERL2-like, partial [Fagus crenata]
LNEIKASLGWRVVYAWVGDDPCGDGDLPPWSGVTCSTQGDYGIFNPAPPSSFSLSRFSGAVRVIGGSLRYTERGISFSRIRCAAASDGKKVSSRLSQVQ